MAQGADEQNAAAILMLKTEWFEKIILRTLSILLMVIIAVATMWLVFLFAFKTWERIGDMRTTLEMQQAVQNGLGGIFVVLLGLELLETIKTYAAHRRFRLEVVLVVGAIAVARHIIQLDFHHIDGVFLGGLGVLIAALVGGFYVLQRIPESQGGSLHVEAGASK